MMTGVARPCSRSRTNVSRPSGPGGMSRSSRMTSGSTSLIMQEARHCRSVLPHRHPLLAEQARRACAGCSPRRPRGGFGRTRAIRAPESHEEGRAATRRVGDLDCSGMHGRRSAWPGRVQDRCRRSWPSRRGRRSSLGFGRGCPVHDRAISTRTPGCAPSGPAAISISPWPSHASTAFRMMLLNARRSGS